MPSYDEEIDCAPELNCMTDRSIMGCVWGGCGNLFAIAVCILFNK